MYADQSASALRLGLLEGALDTAPFDVLARDACPHPDGEIEAAILGASHLVRIHRGEAGPDLWEVLACGAIAETGTPQALRRVAPLAELPEGLRLTLRDGARYGFEACTTNLREGCQRLGRLERTVRTAAQRGAIGLSHRFASRDGRAPGPLTLVAVGVEALAGRVRIETAHGYPDEDAIVFTRSWLEPGRPRAAP